MIIKNKENNLYIPEYIGQNLNVNHIFGKCKCGKYVVSYEKYCSECGVELDWETMKEELNMKGLNF